MPLRHNFEAFEKAFLRMLSRRREDQIDISKTVILDTLTFLILASPVDQGRYKGAHEITFGEPATSTGLTIRGSGETQSAGKRKLSELKLETLKTHGKIFITNPLIYAWAIERGHSKKAPKGVYRRGQVHAQRLYTRITTG